MGSSLRTVLRCLPTFLTLVAGMPACGQSLPLRVGLVHTEPWAYYNDRDASAEHKSQLTGIFVDLNRELARETGLSLEATVVPYSRAGKDLQNGDSDLAYLIRTDSRNTQVDSVALLFSFQGQILARPGTPLRGYDDLKPLRIGVLKDMHLSARFDHDGGLNKIELRDYETMVDMFLSGRLDAIAGSDISLHYLLRKRCYGHQPWTRMPLQKVEVWALMSKKSTQLSQLPRLRAAIDKLRGEGFFDALLERHLSTAEEGCHAKRSMRDTLAPAPLASWR